MESLDIILIAARGEDSTHQLKTNYSNIDQLNADMVAFSNSYGGKILVGIQEVKDQAALIIGLNDQEIKNLNQMISSSASQGVVPAVNPKTTVVDVNGKLVLVIEIPEGINKPYQDKNGVFWVKNGSDKRKATDREELQRLFQNAGLVHADEVPVNGSGISDLDLDYFSRFYKKRFGRSLEDEPISIDKILENMNLSRNNQLNLAAILLFSTNPDFRVPAFILKARSYLTDTASENSYLDSQDIRGKLTDVLHRSVNFILMNIHHIQAGQSVNSLGQSEIPRIVLEELIANALMHRDYFISAPIRVFIFSNRVEIISPGHLPNNLTVENIKAGNSNMRNPVLASFAVDLLPYQGIGTGILRALKNYPYLDFEDDRDGNQFKCIIHRQNKINELENTFSEI
jgi:ATP-dependent DNA helicase RecG